MVVDIVAVVAVVGSAAVSIIHGIQGSKCNWIKCGCIECTRRIDEDKPQEEERLQQNDDDELAYNATPVITGRTSIK